MKVKYIAFFLLTMTMTACGGSTTEEKKESVEAEDSITTEQLEEIIEIDSSSIEINSEVKTLDNEVDEILKGLEE